MRGLRYSRALFVLHPYCLSINICNLRKKKAQGGRERQHGSQRLYRCCSSAGAVPRCPVQFAICTLHFVLCTVHSALCTGKQLGAQTSLHQLEFHQSQDYITLHPLFPSLLVTLSSLFICIRSLPLLSSVVKKGAWTDILVFAILD